jgi:hypothetical protein
VTRQKLSRPELSSRTDLREPIGRRVGSPPNDAAYPWIKVHVPRRAESARGLDTYATDPPTPPSTRRASKILRQGIIVGHVARF